MVFYKKYTQFLIKYVYFRKVVLQENKAGDMEIRNLSLHLVSTFEEAMSLLSVGDTNRYISN